MREFRLTENKPQELKSYTIIVDGEKGDFDCQNVWTGFVENKLSFMNIFFTVDKNGKVVDVSVKVND